MIFERIGIDTSEVLDAAGTKWNFLPFRPGLVGGHCIGVDPYYLTHKAEELGHHPEMILAGRRINDRIGSHIASQVVKKMLQKEATVSGGKALVLGLTFKENCPDLRNTKVVDLIRELQAFGLNVDVHDPWADSEEAIRQCGIELLPAVQDHAYDAIILAVAHREFVQLGIEMIRSWGHSNAVIYDVKSLFAKEAVDGRL